MAMSVRTAVCREIGRIPCDDLTRDFDRDDAEPTRIVKRVPTLIGSESGLHIRTPGSITGASTGELTAAKALAGDAGRAVVLSTDVERTTPRSHVMRDRNSTSVATRFTDPTAADGTRPGGRATVSPARTAAPNDGQAGRAPRHIRHVRRQVSGREDVGVGGNDGLTGYDVTGDVNGHVDALSGLLGTMGYRRTGASFRSPKGRTAVFVGDLIDRGPQQMGTLRLLRSMVEAGDSVTDCAFR